MTNKIKLLKGLDTLLGPIAVRIVKLLFSPRQTVSEVPESILILRPGGIGDAVLLIPAIHSIKTAFPQAGIDILAEKRNSEVFSLCPAINKLLLYDRPKELFQAIRGRYDAVIDTEQWYRLSAVMAYLTGAPIRIGFSTNKRRDLFNSKVSYSQDEHEIDSFLNLASQLTKKEAYKRSVPFISLHPAATDYVNSLLKHFSGLKIIALFPGGSTEEKRWEAEKFYELSFKLNKEGYAIVVVGSRDDLSSGAIITDGIPESLNLCGKLSLTESAAVLKEASLLITGDSGIMHLAFGLGSKTVSLFGPGNYRKWAPPGDKHRMVSKNVSCSPCSRFGHTPGCRRGRECMKLITVDEVFQQAMQLLKE
ncbi:MAG: glycosyltransferase family 9 protein [Proteobacteria bacterium]|nr:glycosyltransferase family 9 protein [Pseudomonadota bacterium]